MKKKAIIPFILFATFFFLPPNLLAQLGSLSRGDRIRFSIADYFASSRTGTFEKSTADSIFIKVYSGTIAIPILSLRKMEVSKGRTRHTVAGLITGSVLGGLGLGVAMHAAEQNRSGYGSVGQPGFWGGFASGALLGGGIGAFIGYKIESDRWKEITLERK